MPFRTFNRRLFAALEATGGTAETITTSTDYFEASDINFTVTPLMFERAPKSVTLTQALQATPGSSRTAPCAMVEMTFTCELAPPSSGLASGTAPKIGTLLKACGMTEHDVYGVGVTAGSWTGATFNNEETVGASAESKYFFGDHFYGDDAVYYTAAAATALSQTAQTGEVSGSQYTTGAAAISQLGVGYRFKTTSTDSNVANTSATVRIYLDDQGSYVEAKGCRGNVEFVMNHGDVAKANFTIQGVLNEYVDSGSRTNPTDYTYTAKTPAAFVNAAFAMGTTGATDNYWTGALFNTITINAGNELAVRTDSNDSVGYKDAIITGRAPTMTFNPDAVESGAASSPLDLWDQFLGGSPMKAKFRVGRTVGNTIWFRMPALQFTGVADGERDAVQVFDATCAVTGGNIGSSLLSEGATTQSHGEFGQDNELTIVFR